MVLMVIVGAVYRQRDIYSQNLYNEVKVINKVDDKIYFLPHKNGVVLASPDNLKKEMNIISFLKEYEIL